MLLNVPSLHERNIHFHIVFKDSFISPEIQRKRALHLLTQFSNGCEVCSWAGPGWQPGASAAFPSH